MIGLLALLGGSLLVGSYGHRALFWLANRNVDPTVLLTGWVVSTVGLVASTTATAGLVALPTESHGSSDLFALAGECWTALSAGSVPGWLEALAAVSVACAVGILVRLAWAVTARLRRNKSQAPHLAQLRMLASATSDGEPLWVQEERPLAMSIGGRPGLIVASEALRRELPPAAVAATLEHERAHLRGRHHTLVAIAEVLASALPFCPLLREAPSAIRDLVELAADAEAARRCGTAAVREALSRLTGVQLRAGTLAMAGRLTQHRIARLAHSEIRPNRILRLTECAGVALTAAILPLSAAWVAVDVVRCFLV